MSLWKIELTAPSALNGLRKFRTVIDAESFEAARNAAIAEAPSAHFALPYAATQGSRMSPLEAMNPKVAAQHFIKHGFDA